MNAKFKAIPILVLVLVIVTVGFFVPLQVKPKKSIHLENSAALFSPSEFRVSQAPVGCKHLVDQYCSKLYSSQARGNLKVTGGKSDYWTFQGQTHNNFDNAWFAYYQARLVRKKKLPLDLHRALEHRDFFKQLEKTLTRPSKRNLKFDSGLKYKELEDSVDSIWEHAIDETVARRLEKKFPGSYVLTEEELPQEADLERWRIRYSLWSEISMALWKGNDRWRTVQKEFGHLKSAFQSAIENLNLDALTKQRWLDKIHRVELTLPGQNPMTANQDCIATSRNAFYYPYLNTLTVCAGYFNGGEQIQTLAHELAHALDFNSRLVDFNQSSQLAHSLRDLRRKICSPAQFNCEDWTQFKQRFSTELNELSSFQPEVKSFHQCLQKNPPSRRITESVIKKKAEKITRYNFSDLTKNSSFFRLTSPKLPLPTGEVIANPNLLNPCAYDLWSSETFPLDSDLSSLLFFTAAYQCEAESSQKNIRTAVNTSREMTQALVSVALRNEAEFSARDEMQSELLSSPSTERFADRMGSFVVGEYLNRFKSSQEKRAVYLVSSFWLCEKPSLRSSNIQEFQALSDLIVDRSAHAESDARMMDWLSPPVRHQLNCELDFSHRECSL